MIVAHRSEMGTGIRTSLPIVLADELEADWTRVTHRPGHRRQEVRLAEHRRLVLDQGFLRGDARRRRHSAHDARAGAAAQVERAGCRVRGPQPRRSSTSRSKVARRSANSSRRRDSCRFRNAKSLRFKTPTANTATSARPSRSIDLDDIVKGKAYSASTRACRAWCYASVARPPVLGGTLKSRRRCGGAKKVRGVQQTSSRSPRPSRRTCSRRSAASRSLPTTRGRRCRAARSSRSTWDARPPRVVRLGVATARSSSTTVASRRQGRAQRRRCRQGIRKRRRRRTRPTYYTPMLAHAPMEPPAAVAEFQDGKVVIGPRRRTRRPCRTPSPRRWHRQDRCRRAT